MRIFTVIPLIVVLLLSGCARNYAERMEASEEAFYSGDYNKAAQTTLSKLQEGSKNSLLYMMEAGMMLHAGEDYKRSNEILLKAAKLSEELKISVTKQAASVLLNERSTNYRGENFERVLIHTYIGINFMMMENFESARVEFQKVSRMLKNIKDSGGPDFEQSVLARYLTALCYESIGDTDNDYQAHEFAYLEYKKVYELKPSLPMIKADLVRVAEKLGDTEDLSIWKSKFGAVNTGNYKNSGELVVIHQAGRGAYKKSRGTLLDDEGMRVAIVVSLNNMTLQEGVTVAAILIALKNIEHPIPDYVTPQNRIHHINISSADNAFNSRTYSLENITATAKLSAENKYRVTRKKVAAGIAVKAVATYASSVAAEKIAEKTQFKDASKAIGFITGAAVGTTLASQIKPDLRCWRTLPAEIQISRINLQPGKYDILINSVDKNGTSYNVEKKTVTIEKEKRTVLNFRTLR